MDASIKFEDTKETKRYSSFPDGGLSDADYRALRRNQQLEDVHPVAGFPTEDRITHFGFSHGGFRRFVGWDAENEEWLQIVKMPEEFDSDDPIEFEVVSIFDDEDGEAIFHFGEYIENGEFSVDGLYEFLDDYLSHIYGEENAPMLFQPTDIE